MGWLEIHTRDIRRKCILSSSSRRSSSILESSIPFIYPRSQSYLFVGVLNIYIHISLDQITSSSRLFLRCLVIFSSTTFFYEAFFTSPVRPFFHFRSSAQHLTQPLPPPSLCSPRLRSSGLDNESLPAQWLSLCEQDLRS